MLLQLLYLMKDLILEGTDICQLTAAGAQVAQQCKDWILGEIRQLKESNTKLLNSTLYLTVIFMS